MSKALKTCLECGELSEQSRCPKHRTEYNRERGSAAARGYDAKWRKMRKAAVVAHIQRFGEVCPGWKRDPHTAPKATLEGDHRVSLAMGGKNEPSNIDVLCRSCNARKGMSSGGSSNPEPAVPLVPVKKRFLIYDYDHDCPVT